MNSPEPKKDQLRQPPGESVQKFSRRGFNLFFLNMSQKPAGRKGFTLIEVLLAITLFAVVSSSAVSVFSMGLQIWKRTRQTSAVERKAVLALEKMAQDLREMIRVKAEDEKFTIQDRPVFSYGGKTHEIRIPSVLAEPQAAGMGGFAQKTYWWDSGKKQLCRSVETAADLFRKRPPQCQAAVQHITKLKFRYRLPGGITGSFSWYDEWEIKDGLPLGVEIEMEVTPPDSKSEKRILKRSVAIPAAGEEEEAKK